MKKLSEEMFTKMNSYSVVWSLPSSVNAASLAGL
jgi:hypothetical protein